MKTAIFLLIIFHGLTHLMGFSKAFNLEPMNQLNQNITAANGILWLVCSLLFVTTAFLFFLETGSWRIVSLAAVLLSQYLISITWSDSKFGTIINVIILVTALIGYAKVNFSKKYANEVTGYLKKSARTPNSLLTDADIQHLPNSVKKYLHYTGAAGKPKTEDVKVQFAGQINHNEKSKWIPFTSEQYNFMGASTRLFCINSTLEHLPVTDSHYFKHEKALASHHMSILVR